MGRPKKCKQTKESSSSNNAKDVFKAWSELTNEMTTSFNTIVQLESALHRWEAAKEDYEISRLCGLLRATREYIEVERGRVNQLLLESFGRETID